MQSPIITAFAYPTPDFDFEKFYSDLSDEGFVLYPGKTKAGDTHCFRVGNIGEIYPRDCHAFIKAVQAWQVCVCACACVRGPRRLVHGWAHSSVRAEIASVV